MKRKNPAWIVLSILLITTLSCNFITQPGSNSGPKSADPTVVPTPPVLGQAPAVMVLPAGSPEQQAAAFSRAIEQAADPNSRLSAWLGIYAALGIPVLGEDGIALTNTADDPAGAPYWQIWFASGMSFPKRGMTLSDAGTILTSQPDGSYDRGAGQILLQDLRAASQSGDAQMQLFGYFVRARVLDGYSGLDMLDPQANPDALVIDPASVNLLHWALNRNLLAEIARANGTSSIGQHSRASFNAPFAGLAAAGKPRCAEMFGSEDTTAAVNWLANKFYSGLSVPFTSGLPGMSETVLKQIGVSVQKIEKISKFVSRANAIGTLLSFYMQIHALTIDWQQTPLPLVRTKSTSDGEKGVITWHLYYDKNKTPDGNELWACMTNFITNAFGVTLALPPSEDIAGADIIFDAGKNIPEKVLIDSENTNYRITTNSSGQADLKVIGRAQKKKLPDSAPAYDDEFILNVYAQPEGVTGSSLVNTFVDSLAFFAVPSAAAAVSPLIDILKTVHFSLGEVAFPLTDWRAGFQAQGGQGIDIAGTICNGFTEKFSLEGAVPDGSQVTFSYSPSSETGGTYTYNGAGGGISFSGNGSYSISAGDGDTFILTQSDLRGCVQGVGSACQEYVNTITLTPIDSCKP